MNKKLLIIGCILVGSSIVLSVANAIFQVILSFATYFGGLLCCLAWPILGLMFVAGVILIIVGLVMTPKEQAAPGRPAGSPPPPPPPPRR